MIRMVILAVALTGCATVDRLGDQASEAADAYFETSRRVYCDGQTIGAVRRALGADPEALRHYLDACDWVTWE